MPCQASGVHVCDQAAEHPLLMLSARHATAHAHLSSTAIDHAATPTPLLHNAGRPAAITQRRTHTFAAQGQACSHTQLLNDGYALTQASLCSSTHSEQPIAHKHTFAAQGQARNAARGRLQDSQVGPPACVVGGVQRRVHHQRQQTSHLWHAGLQLCMAPPVPDHLQLVSSIQRCYMPTVCPPSIIISSWSGHV